MQERKSIVLPFPWLDSPPALNFPVPQFSELCNSIYSGRSFFPVSPMVQMCFFLIQALNTGKNQWPRRLSCSCTPSVQRHNSPGRPSGHPFSSSHASGEELGHCFSALPGLHTFPRLAAPAFQQETAAAWKVIPALLRNFPTLRILRCYWGFTSCFKVVLKTNLWYLHRYMGWCKELCGSL